MKKPHIKVMKDSAKYFGLDFKKFDPEEMLHTVSDGKKTFWLDRSATAKTSRLSYIIADNKRLTVASLNKFGIPTPKQELVTKYKDLLDFYHKHKPVVIKPNKCSLGKGVAVGVNSLKALRESFDIAQKYDKRVLIETYVPGEDYRFTVINYKTVYALKRIPAFVVGDGKHTVSELIDMKNAVKKLYKKDIKQGDKSVDVLKKQGLKLNSKPAKDQIVYLRKAANIAEGGTSIDVTDIASKALKDLAISACKALKLPSAGIDILTEDISSDKGVVLEVNPRAHIILHHYPHEGQVHYPGRDIMKMLFPTAKAKK